MFPKRTDNRLWDNVKVRTEPGIPTDGCLSAEELVDYARLGDKYLGADRAAVHIAGCDLCRDVWVAIRLDMTPEEIKEAPIAFPEEPTFFRSRWAWSASLAAAASLMLITVTLGLQNHTYRLRVLALEAKIRQERNEALAAQRSQQAEIARLSESVRQSHVLPAQLPGQIASVPVGAGASLIMLPSGAAIMGRPVPQGIASDIQNKRLSIPEGIRDQIRASSQTAGAHASAGYALLSPVETAVLSSRPTFSWTPVAGADRYEIEISDSNYNVIHLDNPVSHASHWSMDAAHARAGLAPGQTYHWQVAAKMPGGADIQIPTAWFTVLSAHDRGKVESEAEPAQGAPLLLGCAYANAGLLDDAERQLRKAASAQPKSPLALQLLSNLLSERKKAGSTQRPSMNSNAAQK